jgi:hypothetical protein
MIKKPNPENSEINPGLLNGIIIEIKIPVMDKPIKRKPAKSIFIIVLLLLKIYINFIRYYNKRMKISIPLFKA